MTLYQRPSFTVPAVGKNNPSMCAEKGHSMADRKGLCIACGETLLEARGTAWADEHHPSMADTVAAFRQGHPPRDAVIVSEQGA